MAELLISVIPYTGILFHIRMHTMYIQRQGTTKSKPASKSICVLSLNQDINLTVFIQTFGLANMNIVCVQTWEEYSSW